MSTTNLSDHLMEHIDIVPHNGIPQFYDIGPLLRNPALLYTCCKELCLRINVYKPDSIAGVDARGFIFGPIMAHILNIPFIMMRKKGKLPNAVHSKAYIKEYGDQVDQLCVQQNSVCPNDRVVIVDDLIATGGTMASAVGLIRTLGAVPVACACAVEIKHFHASELFPDVPIVSIFTTSEACNDTDENIDAGNVE